jgi:NAD(P)-dependent dehydrogenase (short-subunit alcohol dehydrogenase family)
VAVHYRTSAAEAQDTVARCARHGARAEAFAPTWPTRRSARPWCPRWWQAFGRLDAVVNNASLFEYDDVASFGYAAMERHWRANTAPAVLLARALHRRAARPAAAARWSTCSTRSSGTRTPTTSRTRCPRPRWKPPPRCWRRRWRRAVRVCGVAPGVTLVSGPMDDAEFEASHRMTPLRRSSTPQDVARAVRFLLESPAITGTTLLVDGGQHLLAAAARRDVPRRESARAEPMTT